MDNLKGYIRIVKKSGEDGTEYPVRSNAECTIGSGLDCHIRFIEKTLAKKVCSINTKKAKVELQCLTSDNPILVNGVTCNSKKTLENNDIITINGRNLRWTSHSPKMPKVISTKIRRRTSVGKTSKRLSAGRKSWDGKLPSTSGSTTTTRPRKSEVKSKGQSKIPQIPSKVKKRKYFDPQSEEEDTVTLPKKRFFETPQKTSKLPIFSKTMTIKSIQPKLGTPKVVVSKKTQTPKTLKKTPAKNSKRATPKTEPAKKSKLKTPKSAAKSEKKTSKRVMQGTTSKVKPLFVVTEVTPKQKSPAKTKQKSPAKTIPDHKTPKSAKKVLYEKKSDKKVPLTPRSASKILSMKSPKSAKKVISTKKSPASAKKVLSTRKSPTSTRKVLSTKSPKSAKKMLSAKKSAAKVIPSPRSASKNALSETKSSKKLFEKILSAKKTDKTPVKTQASVFTESCSILEDSRNDGVRTPENFMLKPLGTPQSIKKVKSAVKKDASIRKSLSKSYSKRKISDITDDLICQNQYEVFEGQFADSTPIISILAKKAKTEPKKSRNSSVKKLNSTIGNIDTSVISNRSTPRKSLSRSAVHFEGLSPVSKLESSFTSLANEVQNLSGIEAIHHDSDNETSHGDFRSLQRLQKKEENVPKQKKFTPKKSFSLIDFTSPVTERKSGKSSTSKSFVLQTVDDLDKFTSSRRSQNIHRNISQTDEMESSTSRISPKKTRNSKKFTSLIDLSSPVLEKIGSKEFPMSRRSKIQSPLTEPNEVDSLQNSRSSRSFVQNTLNYTGIEDLFNSNQKGTRRSRSFILGETQKFTRSSRFGEEITKKVDSPRKSRMSQNESINLDKSNRSVRKSRNSSKLQELDNSKSLVSTFELLDDSKMSNVEIENMESSRSRRSSPKKSLMESPQKDMDKPRRSSPVKVLMNKSMNKSLNLNTSTKSMNESQSLNISTSSLNVSQNLNKSKESLNKSQNLNISTSSLNKSQNLNKSRKSMNESQNLNISTSSLNKSQNLNKSRKSMNESQNLNVSTRSLNKSHNLNKSRKSKNESQNLNVSTSSLNKSQNLNKSRKSMNESQNLNVSTRSLNKSHNLNKSRKSMNESQNLNISTRSLNKSQNLNKSRKSMNESQNLDKSSRSRRSSPKKSLALSPQKDMDKPRRSSPVKVIMNKSMNESLNLNTSTKSMNESQNLNKSRKSMNESQNLNISTSSLNKSRKSMNESQNFKISTSSLDESQNLNKSRKSINDSQNLNKSRKSMNESQNNKSSRSRRSSPKKFFAESLQKDMDKPRRSSSVKVKMNESINMSKKFMNDSQNLNISTSSLNKSQNLNRSRKLMNESQKLNKSSRSRRSSSKKSFVESPQKDMDKSRSSSVKVIMNKSLNKSQNLNKSRKSMNESQNLNRSSRSMNFMNSTSPNQYLSQNESLFSETSLPHTSVISRPSLLSALGAMNHSGKSISHRTPVQTHLVLSEKYENVTPTSAQKRASIKFNASQNRVSIADIALDKSSYSNKSGRRSSRGEKSRRSRSLDLKPKTPISSQKRRSKAEMSTIVLDDSNEPYSITDSIATINSGNFSTYVNVSTIGDLSDEYFTPQNSRSRRSKVQNSPNYTGVGDLFNTSSKSLKSKSILKKMSETFGDTSSNSSKTKRYIVTSTPAFKATRNSPKTSTQKVKKGLRQLAIEKSYKKNNSGIFQSLSEDLFKITEPEAVINELNSSSRSTRNGSSATKLGFSQHFDDEKNSSRTKNGTSSRRSSKKGTPEISSSDTKLGLSQLFKEDKKTLKTRKSTADIFDKTQVVLMDLFADTSIKENITSPKKTGASQSRKRKSTTDIFDKTQDLHLNVLFSKPSRSSKTGILDQENISSRATRNSTPATQFFNEEKSISRVTRNGTPSRGSSKKGTPEISSSDTKLGLSQLFKEEKKTLKTRKSTADIFDETQDALMNLFADSSIKENITSQRKTGAKQSRSRKSTADIFDKTQDLHLNVLFSKPSRSSKTVILDQENISSRATRNSTPGTQLFNEEKTTSRAIKNGTPASKENIKKNTNIGKKEVDSEALFSKSSRTSGILKENISSSKKTANTSLNQSKRFGGENMTPKSSPKVISAVSSPYALDILFDRLKNGETPIKSPIRTYERSKSKSLSPQKRSSRVSKSVEDWVEQQQNLSKQNLLEDIPVKNGGANSPKDTLEAEKTPMFETNKTSSPKKTRRGQKINETPKVENKPSTRGRNAKETPVAEEPNKSSRGRKTEEIPVVEEPKKSLRSRKVEEIPVVEEPKKSSRGRKAKEIPVVEEPKKSSRSRKVEEIPVVEEIKKSLRGKKAEEIPVVEEPKKSSRGRKAEEIPVIEEPKKSSRGRKAEEIPVIEEPKKSSRGRKAEEIPVIEESKKSSRGRKAKEIPVVEEPKKSTRGKKAEEIPVVDEKKSSRGRKAEAEEPKKSTRGKRAIESSNIEEELPPKKSTRRRNQNEVEESAPKIEEEAPKTEYPKKSTRKRNQNKVEETAPKKEEEVSKIEDTKKSTRQRNQKEVEETVISTETIKKTTRGTKRTVGRTPKKVNEDEEIRPTRSRRAARIEPEAHQIEEPKETVSKSRRGKKVTDEPKEVPQELIVETQTKGRGRGKKIEAAVEVEVAQVIKRTRRGHTEKEDEKIEVEHEATPSRQRGTKRSAKKETEGDVVSEVTTKRTKRVVKVEKDKKMEVEVVETVQAKVPQVAMRTRTRTRK